MAGYPNKITRASLGPTYVDAVKPANPQTELTAGVFNLLAWQAAGMNGPAARVFSYCKITAGVLTQQVQALAWDPDGALPVITWVRSATGVYTWQMPNGGLGVGIYPDQNGNPTSVGLVCCWAAPQGTGANIAVGAVNPDGVSGTLNCYVSASGGAVDPAGFGFWVM